MASTTTISASAASSTPSATCITIAPGKNGYLPPESCDAILYYIPSFEAAIFLCVLYGLVALVHIIQAIIYKKVTSLPYRFPVNTIELIEWLEICLGTYYGCCLGAASVHFSSSSNTPSEQRNIWYFLCHIFPSSPYLWVRFLFSYLISRPFI